MLAKILITWPLDINIHSVTITLQKNLAQQYLKPKLINNRSQIGSNNEKLKHQVDRFLEGFKLGSEPMLGEVGAILGSEKIPKSRNERVQR